MQKPRILLSCSKAKEAMGNYACAVEAAGGLPCGGYCPDADAATHDGLLLCGGGDLAPALYHAENCGSTGIDPARDEAEWRLLAEFVRLKKPVFGVCRGLQFANVFFGGTLIQDISPALQTFHRQWDGVDGRHAIRAEKGSPLAVLYGEAFLVNSSHHQAAERLGEGLAATAWSESGLVEALEHVSLPVFCVQFHPERLSLSHQKPGLIDGLPLFCRFVQACGGS